MSDLRERIEDRLRERLAAIYADSQSQVDEAQFQKQVDPLFEHLDQLIYIVARTRDYSTEPYRNLVREIICTNCHMTPSGYCPHENEVGCTLDAHFQTILGIIEKELEADPGLP